MTDLELDTGTDVLIASVTGCVAVLTINRPEAANALVPELHDAFGRVLPAIGGDRDIRCVVVTGTGRHFCAGGDVKRMGNPDGGTDLDGLQRRQRVTTLAIARLPQVTVAALPGPAVGAGMSIALACDLRVGARRASFITGFSRVGSSGDFGGSYFLPRLVGLARAKELYLLSDPVDAERAEQLGLLNRVFDDDEFASGWMAYAERIAAGAPLAQELIVANLNESLTTELDYMLDLEARSTIRCVTSDDHREAVAAIRERRPPNFSGADPLMDSDGGVKAMDELAPTEPLSRPACPRNAMRRMVP